MTTEGEREPKARPPRGSLPSADDARLAYTEGLDPVVAREIDSAYEYLRKLRRRKTVVFTAEILVVFIAVAAVAVGIYLLATSNPAAGGLTVGLGTLLSAAYLALDRAQKSIEKTEVRIENHLAERIRVREVIRLNLIAGNGRGRNSILTDLAAAVTGLVSDTPKELQEDAGKAPLESAVEPQKDRDNQHGEGT